MRNGQALVVKNQWQVLSIGTVAAYSAKYSALVAYKGKGKHRFV